MNPTPSNEPEAIRSEIDSTRRHMDDTMDALRERLQGRHLIDEVLGFFRNDPARSREIGQKLSQTASTAMHSFTDTVKANPVPALLIGAGVAWMIYDSRRKSSMDDYEQRYDDAGSTYAGIQNDPDAESLYDRPLDYPSSAATQTGLSGEAGYNAGGYATGQGDTTEGGTSKLRQAKDRVVERASQAGHQVRERLSNLGSRVREGSAGMTEHARELGSRVQERARMTYERSRERVVTTATEHPLEVGLACLAAGVIAGLSIPTPERLNRLAGPTVDRLRDRTREAGSELMHKGQRVANAAAEAVKQEAQNQGLTPEHLREQAGAVAGRAREAATETARSEGLTPGSNNPGGQSGQTGNQPNQPQTDPLASRPVM